MAGPADRAMARWRDNAKHAMLKKPDYFVWWYTAKSIGLCAAVGVAAYYAGKASGMREAGRTR